MADQVLNKLGHANFCMRCLYGLPDSMAEADSSRVAVGFYCLGALDVLGLLDAKLKDIDRMAWRSWIWEQQVTRPASPRATGGSAERGGGRQDLVDSHVDDGAQAEISDEHVGGFRPSPFMDVGRKAGATRTFDADPSHLIMTYTALLSLAILRDDFARLDRRGLVGLLRATQQADGSFTAIPRQGEADIRMVYTAFAICTMLNDWSGVDVPRALGFVKRCITFEGGFGQTPGNEAQGGPTYCALATLALAPAEHKDAAALSPAARRRAIRWLVQTQSATEGGFAGRTQKDADACYSFWCGGAMHILGADALVERGLHARFLAGCQYRVGGFAKAPDVHADPYHTYLSLAALSLYPPVSAPSDLNEEEEGWKDVHSSWTLPRLDVLLNATEETSRWVRTKMPRKSTDTNDREI